MKKIVSLVLVLLLTAGLFHCFAGADCTPSRDEALRWLNDQEGVWYDLDGKYGAQCSDFVSAYMNWLYSGYTNPNLGYAVYNASYYPTVAGWNTDRWDVFNNTSSFSPEPGDIFVQSSHVGVVLSGSKTSAKVIDQNSWETWALAEQYGGTGRAARIYSTNISDATHFIRYRHFGSNTYELDVNGWLDGAESKGVSGYATFDVYINGSLAANDVSDFCQSYSAGTTYEIKDIKVAAGKSFDGYSSYTYSGHASGGCTGTLNTNADVRLQLHTVDAAGFSRTQVPSSVSVFNGHSYYFYDAAPLTWYAAETVSEYLGGHLVTIRSVDENSFITSLAGNTACWTGATDRDSEGTWKWVNGESFWYANWDENQPDNYGGGYERAENYAQIKGNSGGRWSDNAGCVQLPFVCEIDRAYSISYNANGGSKAPSAQEKAVGQSITLSTNVPTRDNYSFLGWATSASATTPLYQPGDTYSRDAGMTLYAVWQRLFDNLLVLPRALTVIEDEAFLDSAADAVVIPASVTEIGKNPFGDIAVYGYAGSYAESWAKANGKVFIPISDGWVLADQVPQGARVTEEKWTYQKSTTESMTSTDPAVDGWTQAGYELQQTGSGTHVYAYFPEGFDTGHSLYSAYAKNALTDYENATTKRTVSASEVKDYIYWHWTWFWGSSENKLINDCYCVEDGREFNNFKAYENGYIEYVSGHNYVKWDRGGAEDGSCWWFRFDVYRQTYTDYRKLFTYTRTVVSDETSTMPVAEGEGISNVQHWVKYTL